MLPQLSSYPCLSCSVLDGSADAERSLSSPLLTQPSHDQQEEGGTPLSDCGQGLKSKLRSIFSPSFITPRSRNFLKLLPEPGGPGLQNAERGANSLLQRARCPACPNGASASLPVSHPSDNLKNSGKYGTVGHQVKPFPRGDLSPTFHFLLPNNDRTAAPLWPPLTGQTPQAPFH
jgi:hypothetical protein